MAALAKFLILLLWTTMVVEGNRALFPFPGVPSKTIVQIIDNLTDPPQNLTLHCKSKDDDLGEHTIGVGKNYEFKFRSNVLKPVTLFFCSFRWPSDASSHSFDIYVQKRDENSCVEHKGVALCSWKIWKGGGDTGLFPSKTTVQIVNTLAHHEDVTIHCKDKHNDLGEHVLKFREMFEFRFKPNPFLKVTLYFCSFWWPILSEPHYFDIYIQERDTCTVCNWHVNYYGPCLFGVCYPWHYKYQPPLSADAPLPLAGSNANITQSLP
ncbi:uncharacterized protein LOC129302533 [Prosopis cineraria]|uniref:uncharacterized protein LOC129297219 n=1 Tax=Prosopis cineraria TaxID=364024 RepID=UPI002410B18E|nr:uncharacterized protein LOC129297219 [Prosopis cineraria]XP_054797450.1 uncharacterized protein LOC129302533 [Prosopis cineraria]